MAIKTREQIRDEMRSAIWSRQPSADLSSGTILSDIFITPHTYQMADLYTNIQSTKDSFDLDKAVGSDLDVAGKNEGKTRLNATKATGRVLLIYSNITSPIPINAGYLVSTSGGTPKMYRITESVTFDPTYKRTYYSNLLPYEDILRTNNILLTSEMGGLFVKIEAEISGVSGNAGPYTINVTRASGTSYCLNLEAVKGGQDIESDSHFRDRIRLARQGAFPGTPNGFKMYVLDNYSSVDSIYVAGQGDPLLSRNKGYGGAVDIILKSEATLTTYRETILYSSLKDIVLSYQPVNRILSCVNKTKGITYRAYDGSLVTDEVLFDLSKDITNLGRSISAQDKMIFRNKDLADGPVDGNFLEVEYERNEILAVVQSDLKNDENNTYSDVLVKDMRGVLIDVGMDIRPTGDIAVSDIETRIQDFINNKASGEDVEYSDLLGAVSAGGGVDEIIKSSIRISKRYVDDVGFVVDINDTVPISDLEYAVAGNINVRFI